MSELHCSNCGKLHESDSKNCEYCGNDLKEAILRFKQRRLPIKYAESIPSQKKREREQATFFCPKCKLENSRENLSCEFCNEDFSKYNISSSVQNHTRKKRAQEEQAFALEDVLCILCDCC